MTTRLTTALRDQIRDLAVASAFKARSEAHDAQEHALGMEAYQAVLTPAERTTAAMLPDGWLRLDDCLRFNAGGYDVTLRVPAKVPVPSAQGNYCHRLGSLTGDLADRVQAHARAGEKIKEDRRRAWREMQAFLAQFSTVAKLRDAWPEGAEFYANLETEGGVRGGLPAVRVDAINRMLGLGPKPATA